MSESKPFAEVEPGAFILQSNRLGEFSKRVRHL